MNVDRIRALATHLSIAPTTLHVGFQMSGYCSPVMSPIPEGNHPDRSGHSCGTVACIAGHARIQQLVTDDGWTVEDATKQAIEEGGQCHDFAAEYLGLDEYEADALFVMMFTSRPLWSVTPHQAARVLMAAADLGEVTDTIWDDVLGPANRGAEAV